MYCCSCWPSTPPGGAQRESINEAPWAPGKVAGQVLRQIFSGADSMSPILVSPHILKSTKILYGDDCSSLPAEVSQYQQTFPTKKICTWLHVVVQSLSCVWLFVTSELQHTRLPCPSPSPRVCANLCPLSQGCHPTISSSVTLFSSCPQSFLASGSFPKSWLFTSGGQSIGASASVLPMNIQGWFPFWLTGFISLQSKGLSRVFFSTTVRKYQFFGAQLSSWSNSHIHTWLLEEPQLWLYGPLSAKWCLCFLIQSLGLS